MTRTHGWIAAGCLAAAVTLGACEGLRPKEPGAEPEAEKSAAKAEPASVMPASDRYSGNPGVAQ